MPLFSVHITTGWKGFVFMLFRDSAGRIVTWCSSSKGVTKGLTGLLPPAPTPAIPADDASETAGLGCASAKGLSSVEDDRAGTVVKRRVVGVKDVDDVSLLPLLLLADLEGGGPAGLGGRARSTVKYCIRKSAPLPFA